MGSDLKSLVAGWEGLGVVARYDRPAAAWIFIALHDASLGQPTGGTRMRAYRRPEDGLVDALRLAEGMPQKWAAADAPFGGGKGVLALSRVLDRRETDALLRRYGRLVEALGGAFATAPDMNVGPDELAVIAGETQYVHCYDRVQGKPVDPGPYSARGVRVDQSRRPAPVRI